MGIRDGGSPATQSERDSYTQCELVKGSAYQVSWIPSRFAKVGEVLKLRDSRGQWDNGWCVTKTYRTTSAPQVSVLSRLHLRNRKHSDN